MLYTLYLGKREIIQRIKNYPEWPLKVSDPFRKKKSENILFGQLFIEENNAGLPYCEYVNL